MINDLTDKRLPPSISCYPISLLASLEGGKLGQCTSLGKRGVCGYIYTPPLPPPSCPTVDGGTCVFPFINGDIRLDIGHFSLSNLNPSGSKSYSSCISRDDETFWCLPSKNDWVQCQVDKCPLQSINSPLPLTEGTLSMILHIFSCALRWKTLSDHKI